jgi:hypothetical protein
LSTGAGRLGCCPPWAPIEDGEGDEAGMPDTGDMRSGSFGKHLSRRRRGAAHAADPANLYATAAPRAKKCRFLEKRHGTVAPPGGAMVTSVATLEECLEISDDHRVLHPTSHRLSRNTKRAICENVDGEPPRQFFAREGLALMRNASRSSIVVSLRTVRSLTNWGRQIMMCGRVGLAALRRPFPPRSGHSKLLVQMRDE